MVKHSSSNGASSLIFPETLKAILARTRCVLRSNGNSIFSVSTNTQHAPFYFLPAWESTGLPNGPI
jgi:hypothetical protein